MSFNDFDDIEEAFPNGDNNDNEEIKDPFDEEPFNDAPFGNSVSNNGDDVSRPMSKRTDLQSHNSRAMSRQSRKSRPGNRDRSRGRQNEDSIRSERKSARGGGDKDSRLQRYLASLSDYDRSRYQQLAEKNEKLRRELKGIAHATEEIIKKEKQRKKSRYNSEEDEEVQRKVKQLREQQGLLNQLKKKIASKKRELDTAYQYPLIREKEDELKNLKRILSELTVERDSVLKVKKQQSKALNALKYNKEEEDRRQQLSNQLKKIKLENKDLMEKKGKLEKIMNKNHVKIVNGKVYIRELKKRLHDFKKKNDGVDYRKISEADVTELKEKIEALKLEKKNLEKRHLLDLKNIEKMKHELRQENQRLDRLLTEKDKEMRLNSIKMKELKRLQRHRALKPVKEKIDLGEPMRPNLSDKGIDGPAIDEDEYEFVNDNRDDTNINISQEDERGNQEEEYEDGDQQELIGQGYGDEEPQEEDQNGMDLEERHSDAQEDGGEELKDPFGGEDQGDNDFGGDNRGQDGDNNDPFGGNNDDNDPFGGGNSGKKDEDPFGFGNSNKNDDPFGNNGGNKNEGDLNLDFDDF